ncbi:MAG: hypothetical protein PF541_01495 [Prolixibacteraceae bacterium]|nr:hypothetical protein [Prolixibacteraceae bacterium]
MKKHVFSLVMMLAFILVASIGANAQNTTIDADTIFAGSSKTFTVTLTTNNTYGWELLHAVNNDVANFTYPYDYSTSATTTTADATVITEAPAVDNNSFTTQFLESAAGLYVVRLTETSTYTGAEATCATVRDFFVYIVSFDVFVFASNESGTAISGANLIDCGPEYAPFLNEHPALASWEGVTPKDTTYITVRLLADDGVTLLTGYDWQFQFYFLGQNLRDGANDDSEIQLYDNDATWSESAGSYDYALADSVHGPTITVSNTAGGEIIIPVVTNKLFSNDNSRDIKYSLAVQSTSTLLYDIDDGDSNFNDGQESAAKFTAPQTNTAAEQTIVASPATSGISIGN